MTTSWLMFVRQGTEVERFHATKTLQVETVGTHSHSVALLCWKLSGAHPSVNLLMAALAHDLAEQCWGDIPAPTKRALDISDEVAELEIQKLREHMLWFELTNEETRILKLADILDGMLYCLRERQLGNQLIAPVFSRYKRYFEDLVLYSDSKASEVCDEISNAWREANGGE